MLWASKADKIMNTHKNKSNAHKHSELTKMCYQTLTRNSRTTYNKVEPPRTKYKLNPQKQVEVSLVHDSRCVTHTSLSAHTNKSNFLCGGFGQLAC